RQRLRRLPRPQRFGFHLVADGRGRRGGSDLRNSRFDFNTVKSDRASTYAENRARSCPDFRSARMVRHIAVSLAFFAACAGCGNGGGSRDRVIDVSQDDPKMNAAMEKARSTVGTFTAALASPNPGQRSFTVKVPFTDGKNTEHMWLSPVSFDGTKFHGT